MKPYVMLFLALVSCDTASNEAHASASNERIKERDQEMQRIAEQQNEKQEFDVCIGLETRHIEEIGFCHEDWCGVLLTGGQYCVLRLPVKGAPVKRCSGYMKRQLTQAEYEEQLDKLGNFTHCSDSPDEERQN